MKIDAETMKKQVILHLPYVLFLLVFAKLGEAVRLAPGADASQKLLGLSEGFALAFQSMWPGAAMDWLIGFCGAAIMRLAVYLRGKDAKKYRKNVEYGSARWGNIFGELICKIFRIKEPIAKGLALGSAAHAIGTAKAMEMGEIEGAMSSLSIAVAGILTVVLSSVFAGFM